MATFDQHAYYRSQVLPVWAEYCGYANLGEMHYWLKVLHIPPDLWVWDGEELVPPSSAILTVEQFSAFLERVLFHAGEEQLYIPPPKDRAWKQAFAVGVR